MQKTNESSLVLIQPPGSLTVKQFIYPNSDPQIFVFESLDSQNNEHVKTGGLNTFIPGYLMLFL